MLREQELAAQDASEAERKEKADADAASMTINSTPASSSTVADEFILQANTADSMELCSTAELVELFAEYADADVEQKKDDFFVKDTHADIDIDFDHPALNETAPASALLARVELGDSNEEYSLDDLVSKD